MTDGEPDHVNLRCPSCGSIRRPVISPLIPDHVVVICDECARRRLRLGGPFDVPSPGSTESRLPWPGPLK
jgi:RNase P subunit RPR2